MLAYFENDCKFIVFCPNTETQRREISKNVPKNRVKTGGNAHRSPE